MALRLRFSDEDRSGNPDKLVAIERHHHHQAGAFKSTWTMRNKYGKPSAFLTRDINSCCSTRRSKQQRTPIDGKISKMMQYRENQLSISNNSFSCDVAVTSSAQVTRSCNYLRQFPRALLISKFFWNSCGLPHSELHCVWKVRSWSMFVDEWKSPAWLDI